MVGGLHVFSPQTFLEPLNCLTSSRGRGKCLPRNCRHCKGSCRASSVMLCERWAETVPLNAHHTLQNSTQFMWPNLDLKARSTADFHSPPPIRVIDSDLGHQVSGKKITSSTLDLQALICELVWDGADTDRPIKHEMFDFCLWTSYLTSDVRFVIPSVYHKAFFSM